MQGNCVFVLLHRLDEHGLDEVFARHEPIIAGAEHFNFYEGVVELELEQLVADRVEVEKVEQRVYYLSQQAVFTFI